MTNNQGGQPNPASQDHYADAGDMIASQGEREAVARETLDYLEKEARTELDDHNEWLIENDEQPDPGPDEVGVHPETLLKLVALARHPATPAGQGEAVEVSRLKTLLDGRDAFIVNAGLWSDFVDQLDDPPKPSEAQAVGEISEDMVERCAHEAWREYRRFYGECFSPDDPGFDPEHDDLADDTWPETRLFPSADAFRACARACIVESRREPAP